MIWVDWCIFAVLLISVIVGLLRGFAREVLGLLTWVLAFWLAYALAGPLADWLQPHISVASVRKITAYAVLFLAGLLLGGILTTLISRALRESALSSVDRTLGGGFGLIRGSVLIGAFLLIGAATPLRHDDWWQQSRLMPYFQWLADGLELVIPQHWVDELRAPAVETSTPEAAVVPASP